MSEPSVSEPDYSSEWFIATERDYNYYSIDVQAKITCRCGDRAFGLTDRQETRCPKCGRTYRFERNHQAGILGTMYVTGGPLNTDRRFREMAETMATLMARVDKLEGHDE